MFHYITLHCFVALLVKNIKVNFHFWVHPGFKLLHLTAASHNSATFCTTPSAFVTTIVTTIALPQTVCREFVCFYIVKSCLHSYSHVTTFVWQALRPLQTRCIRNKGGENAQNVQMWNVRTITFHSCHDMNLQQKHGKMSEERSFARTL